MLGMGLTVWVGVAARLLHPDVPLGVEANDMLGVGVGSSSSSSGLSLMVRSSQDALGAAMLMPAISAGVTVPDIKHDDHENHRVAVLYLGAP